MGPQFGTAAAHQGGRLTYRLTDGDGHTIVVLTGRRTGGATARVPTAPSAGVVGKGR